SASVHTAGTTSTGTLAGAGNDGQATCGASGTSGDAWWVMTPTQTGFLRMDTCGSAFDTVLSVHTSCPGNTGNQIMCNDDSWNGGNNACGSSAGSLQSGFDLSVAAGATYYIRMSGYNGNSGGFNLHSYYLTANGSDSCATAQPVTDGAYAYCNCAA